MCKYQFIGIFCILYNRARFILFVFTVYHVYSFVNSTLAFTARYWHYLQKVLVCAKYFQVYILTAHWLKVLQSSTCSWRCMEAEFEGNFYTFEENVFLDCLDLRLQCSLLWTEGWWVEKFLVFFLFWRLVDTYTKEYIDYSFCRIRTKCSVIALERVFQRDVATV